MSVPLIGITDRVLRPVVYYLPKLKEVLELRGQNPEMPIRSLPDLNQKIWGIHRGKVTLIGARTSVGKSTFAIQIAYDLALSGKKVLFLSLEMTVEDILERLFCYEHRIDNQDLRRGRYSVHASKFDEFSEHMKRLKFQFSDCIGKSWEEIDKLLEGLNPKPDAVFIDHINAIRTGLNAKVVIDDYVTNVVVMAKHHNVAVVMCCQINRDNQKDDDKTPQLHELKGSGNLEESADIVMLLHWPYRYIKEGQKGDRNKYMVILAKNRNGPTGYVEVYFEPEYYRFSDVKVKQIVVESAGEMLDKLTGGKGGRSTDGKKDKTGI